MSGHTLEMDARRRYVSPPRTRDERHRALHIANAVRIQRAGLKRHIRGLGRIKGCDMATTIIATAPPNLERWYVFDLLRCIVGIGPLRARDMMYNAGAARCKTIGGLSPNQRQAVIDELHAYAKRAR